MSDETSSDEEERYIPLMMGETPVGRIAIDLSSGRFQGRIQKELAALLENGLKGGLLSISFYGKPGIEGQVMSFDEVTKIHEQLAEYLEREKLRKD